MRRVAQGERIVVTPDGAPVPELRPCPDPAVARLNSLVAVKTFRG
jgi:antitoxin (DNA-binding transcriptional repressor) of toxin-antitoxin stability system